MTVHEQERAVTATRTISAGATTVASQSSPSPRLQRFTKCAGGFYLVMGGINVGLSIGRPSIYSGFADAALFGWVRDAWQSVFMANPAVWAGLLGGGEILIGVALLSGRRWAMAGFVAVVAFHLALMLFGWGVWLWAVPVLAVVVPSARAWARLLSRKRVRVTPGPR
jgi:hypothetical protein